jgi:hypothetical protein
VRALSLGCLVVAATACSLDIFNPGAITEDSLNDATLMGVVVNGVANEFNQIFDDHAGFDGARFSDELAGTGSYFETGRLRRGAIDWEETAGRWGQMHETIWTGQQAWARALTLEDFDQDNSDIMSRSWMMVGFAHERFGELFCEVVYSTGEENQAGAGVLPRTAAFDSAIVSFNRAIQIGNAAGEDADDWVTASHAGLAQAYAGLGNWGMATQHSTQVPTDFHVDAHFHVQVNQNLIYDETWDRNEGGVYGTYAWRLPTQDPRAPFTACGTFDDPTDPKNSDVTATNASGCTGHQGADGVTAHYRQDKYDDDGSDIPVATGVDMRLIEAEAALEANDLATFTDRINDVRDFYELPLISEPASAGALEYPNAYDANTGSLTTPLPGTSATDLDAWSVLDGERWLTTWLEGRRMWDLHRWDHPFLDGGIVFWDTEPRRASCYPVPEQECQLNRNLVGTALLTGTGNETLTCN